MAAISLADLFKGKNAMAQRNPELAKELGFNNESGNPKIVDNSTAQNLKAIKRSAIEVSIAYHKKNHGELYRAIEKLDKLIKKDEYL
jgi:hypothetical protein